MAGTDEGYTFWQWPGWYPDGTSVVRPEQCHGSLPPSCLPQGGEI